MKQTVEVITCDDCGHNIESMEKCFTFSVNIDAGSVRDLCWNCVNARVQHSFTVVKSPKCKTCGGKGVTRELVSYHNDGTDYITCKNCSGKGKVI